MTKTEIIRQALIDAQKRGVSNPSNAELAAISGGSIEAAKSAKRRVLARGLTACDPHAPTAPSNPAAVPPLPLGISLRQYLADRALFDHEMAECRALGHA